MQDIEIPVLMLYSGIYQLLINKQVNGAGFYGFCRACQTDCTDTLYVKPFKNSIIKTFQDAGLLIHVVRSKPFNDAVTDFIDGTAGECDPYFGIHVDSQANCPTCVQP